MEILIAWWPMNGRSSRALREFESFTDGYWSPPGVPPQLTKFAPGAPESSAG